MQLREKTKKILWAAGSCALLGTGIYFLNKYHEENMARRYQETYDTLDLQLADTDTVEYGDTFDQDALVLDHHGELTSEGTVDPAKVGEYTITYTLSAKDPEYSQTVEKQVEKKINVVDTQMPEITISEEFLETKEGMEFSADDNVEGASDPVDGDLEYTLETDLDTEEPGEYTVTVSAEDKNGNTSEKEFYVTVKSRPQFSGNAGICFDYLTETMGLNDAAACGVMANIRYESTFEPTAEDYYYGLCQWGDSRRDYLYSWCSDNGYGYDTVEGQMAFLHHELTTSYTRCWNALQNVEDSADGAYEAGRIFCVLYEGAASVGGRPDLARDYYNS